MEDLICRCCSVKLESEGISFHLNMKGAGDELTLGDKLMECIPEIKIRKDSQDVICVNCFAMLTTAHNFRNICLETNRKLHGVDKVKEADDHGIVELNTEEKSQRVDVKLMGELECKVFVNTLPKIGVKHLEKGNSMYCCDLCKSLFVDHGNYVTHILKKCYRKCLYCNMKFRSFGAYKRHMKLMHSRQYRVYKLKDWKEDYPDISAISQNFFIFETDPDLNVQLRVRSRCVMCKQQFLHHAIYLMHLTIHEPYCFRCLECNSLEADKSLHETRSNCSSTNFEPPWFVETRCPFCCEGFHSVMELYDHITAHKNLKKFCFICRIFSSTLWEMGLHLLTNKCTSTHVISILNPNDNFYSCCVCKKIFDKRENLRKHYFSHNGDTLCKKCNKVFVNFVEYTYHWYICKRTPIRENIEVRPLNSVFIKEERESLGQNAIKEERPSSTLEEIEPNKNAMKNQSKELQKNANGKIKEVEIEEQETEMVTSTT